MRHYESDIIILVALIIFLAMLTNAVGIATTVTVVGGNANVPPTINNVAKRPSSSNFYPQAWMQSTVSFVKFYP